MGSIPVERDEEKEQDRDCIKGIGEATDESVVNTNNNSYKHKTENDPLNLLDVKGFLP
jgi:hypothetical protein